MTPVRKLTRQEGIEPPTHSLEGCCSIQLSYWRINQSKAAAPACGAPCQVGAAGFEPATSCSQSRRDTRLRYAPHETPIIPRAKVSVNRSTIGAQLGDQLAKRAPSMADLGFFLADAFAECSAELRGLEVWIVAEPLGAARSLQYHSVDLAPTEDLAPSVHVGRHAHVPGA